MIFLAASLLLMPVQPDTLTLDACYRQALANWPAVVQTDLKRSISELQSENLSSKYLPSFSVRGQAVYHSSVVEFPVEVPGITASGIPKEQYALTLDLDQLIYDGGEVSARKRLAGIEGDLGAAETDVELHQVRHRVDDLYFDVLVLQKQIELARTLERDLRLRLELVQAGIEGGVALRTDADVLEAEILKVGQDLDASRFRRRGRIAALAKLMGTELGAETVLRTPDVSWVAASLEGRRPEYDLFAEQTRRLDELEALNSSALRPRLSGFSQAGFGQPPDLDLFNTDFAPYFILGVRLNWRFWDWSQTSRDRQIRQIEREIVASKEETFSRQQAIEIELHRAEIARLDSALARDDEVIRLRNRIADDAAARLENGVITATDFLIERNQAYRAELQRAIHEIQLAAARVQYATTIGAYL